MQRYCAQLLAILVLAPAFAMGLGTTAAEEDPPYAANEGPVYFMISFDDTFVVDHPKESEVIIVNIGTLVGGTDILDTRFIVDTSLTGITLPDGRKDPKFDDLQDNAATVLGSFYALDEQGFHSVVPAPGAVDVDIQEAVFTASNSGAIDALIADEPFPTTEDVAEVIEAHLPAGSMFTVEDIYEHVFGSAIQLGLTDGSIEGEGELFPYEPDSESIFTFEFKIGEDASFEQDVSQEVPVDIQGPINIDSKTGVLPVIIRSERGFDASLVDIPSLKIGEVGVSQYQLNGDGSLVVKFSVPALTDLDNGGVLTSDTTELTVHGTYTVTEDDGTETVHAFFGTDAVTFTSSTD